LNLKDPSEHYCERYWDLERGIMEARALLWEPIGFVPDGIVGLIKLQ